MEIQLDKTQVVNTFLALASIDNPSYNERNLSDEIQRHLIELGTAFLEDDTYATTGGMAGNLYALCPGEIDLPPLLFVTHMDSVGPAKNKHPVIHKDGTITGSNNTILGADNVAGITAVIEALHYICQKRLPHRHIELIFSCAEEDYCRGMELYKFRRIKSKEAYVVEAAGNIGECILRATSAIPFQIQITGLEKHAGFHPELGVHAISIAAKAISELKLGKINKNTTVNIGSLQGGYGTDTYPFNCTICGEIRSYVHEEALAELDNVKRTFQNIAEEHGAGIEMNSRIGGHSYELSEQEPVLQRFAKACESHGILCKPRNSLDCNDANHFNEQGKQALAISCGVQNPHSLKEYISTDQLVKSTELLVALMTSTE